MKIQRTRNATRNVAVGAALRLYQMIKGSLIVVLIGRLIVCLLFPNFIYTMIFHRESEFRQTARLIDNVVGKK